MRKIQLLLILSALSASSAVKSFSEDSIEPFEAPKYGLKLTLPKDWEVAVREKDEYLFVAKVPTSNPERPGAAACELGLAPASLDEWRTRLDRNEARGGRRGTLVRNEVVKDGRGGDQLVTLREFEPAPGVAWRELSVRLIRNRQLYTFTLSVGEDAWAGAKAAFDAAIASAEFAPPDTGADRLDGPGNRWVQREFKFALDLPDDWKPALAPDQVALLYANGPARGIWADNVLVVASRRRPLDLEGLARDFPDQLRQADPDCEVLSCRVVPQGKVEALETVVRTKRGPFSMTILERRFRGDRFNYETKYTVESERFDALAPAMRRSLDSFEEVPGAVPAAPGSKPA